MSFRALIFALFLALSPAAALAALKPGDAAPNFVSSRLVRLGSHTFHRPVVLEEVLSCTAFYPKSFHLVCNGGGMTSC